MTDPRIRKTIKATLNSPQKRKIRGMVRNTFARAVQARGKNFNPKFCKIERGMAGIMPFTLLVAFSMKLFFFLSSLGG